MLAVLAIVGVLVVKDLFLKMAVGLFAVVVLQVILGLDDAQRCLVT